MELDHPLKALLFYLEVAVPLGSFGFSITQEGSTTGIPVSLLWKYGGDGGSSVRVRPGGIFCVAPFWALVWHPTFRGTWCLHVHYVMDSLLSGGG